MRRRRNEEQSEEDQKKDGELKRKKEEKNTKYWKMMMISYIIKSKEKYKRVNTWKGVEMMRTQVIKYVKSEVNNLKSEFFKLNGKRTEQHQIIWMSHPSTIRRYRLKQMETNATHSIYQSLGKYILRREQLERLLILCECFLQYFQASCLFNLVVTENSGVVKKLYMSRFMAPLPLAIFSLLLQKWAT